MVTSSSKLFSTFVLLSTLKRAMSTTLLPEAATDPNSLLKRMKSCVPPLLQEMHKGQAGRIGIFGGSLEYTGAPYFSAISALRMGADLAHVFCHSQAAPVIKSYSPELIVHPLLDSSNAVEEISEWLPRLHAVIIGPGLGRTKETFKVISEVLEKVKIQNVPIIVDADGLFFLNEHYQTVTGYRKAILTPNAMEFTRLYKAVTYSPLEPAPKANIQDVVQLAEKLGNVTIVCKGQADVISNGHETAVCDSEGSPRRCGGQGDMLGGILATLASWLDLKGSFEDNVIAAAYSASLMTRMSSKKAFAEKRRSTLTTDMIPQIQFAFEDLLG